MREVIGRQGLAANFESYGTVGGVCRWCPRRLRQSKRSHYTPFRCTVYRADPQDVPDNKQEVGQARSRLLDRNSLSQPQKQQRGGRLIRRTEPPPEPEAPRGSQQPSSRLLQRSPSLKNTTKGLTRSTDTLRRSKDGNTKAGSVKQLNDRAKQQNASTNTRFSQEAGKLSQKDWQVRQTALPILLSGQLSLLMGHVDKTCCAAYAGDHRLADAWHARRSS